MSSNTGVKKGSGFRSGRSRSSTDLLLLHLNILIFSFTGVFSKFAAESIRTNGLFSIRTILWGILIIANCGIYAIFWQYILKLFDVNVAKSLKSDSIVVSVDGQRRNIAGGEIDKAGSFIGNTLA